MGSAKPEDPAFGLLSQTDAVIMANLDATEAVGLLSDYFKPYVKASKSSNMICITAPPNLVERIKGDLQTLDAPRIRSSSKSSSRKFPRTPPTRWGSTGP